MKNKIICLMLLSISIGMAQGRSLFNGKNFKGWHIDVPDMDKKDSAVRNPFIIRNGNLVSLSSPVGHIITDASYSNYELIVEYRFSAEAGNCGVLVHCSTPRRLYKTFPQSIECQLMTRNAGDFWVIGEDIKVKNMEKYRGKRRRWGFEENKLRRIKHLEDGAENPEGEWNEMKIRCEGNTVKVWVNGKLMNDGYDATVSKGQIALQAEGSEVEFRKVWLTQL